MKKSIKITLSFIIAVGLFINGLWMLNSDAPTEWLETIRILAIFTSACGSAWSLSCAIYQIFDTDGSQKRNRPIRISKTHLRWK